MNCVLNHHQRYDRSREDRQNQPTRDALVPISQLPNVRGKPCRCRNSARSYFLSDVELRYFRRSNYQLGDSISTVAFHGADVITGIPGNDGRKPW
jgi:hypothetical protein